MGRAGAITKLCRLNPLDPSISVHASIMRAALNDLSLGEFDGKTGLN